MLKLETVEKLADDLKTLAQDIRENKRINMNEALALVVTRAEVATELLNDRSLTLGAIGRLARLREALDAYKKELES